MKRYFLTTVSALALCAAASAQNLNPQVEVTNDYVTDFSDLQKYTVGMMVPDSLLKFNLAFDYAVFDNPYKGSYEFSPYSIRLTPDKSQYDGGRFMLRAGAGYQIKPELKLYWTPVQKEKSRLSVFQDLSGFYGNYYGDFSGFDFREKLGVTGQVNFSTSEMEYTVAYDGMALSKRGESDAFLYHTGKAHMGFRTSVPKQGSFCYELNLDYLFGLDKYCTNVMENALRLYGTMAPLNTRIFRLHVDYDLDGQLYSNSWTGYGYNVRLLPRAAFKFGVLDLSAGVKLSFYELQSLTAKVYPDLRLSLDAVPGYLRIYAGFRGNMETYDYNRIKEVHRRFTYNLKLYGNTIGYSSTDMDAFAGIKGKISSHFQYDISGGCIKVSDLPMVSVLNLMYFKSFNYWHADASLAWTSEHVDVDFGGHFTRTDLTATDVYDFPMLEGDAAVTYNWNRRLFLGVTCEASTERTARSAIPGYVDLGLNAEWRFAGSWSVWVKAGNLLGQEIQRLPGYAEKSPAITGGIGLNF